jgi:hypothetical protein
MSSFSLDTTPYMSYNDQTYDIKNGRVITDGSIEEKKDFILFEGNNNNNDNFKNTALRNIQTTSPLSDLYFSRENLNRVQDLIRYGVFIRSNKQHIISDQSPTELQIIMRGVYLQHSKGADNIQQQVIELDNIVVSWAVPKIVNEIEQFRGYVYDLENLPVPLEHPTNLSSAGTKALRSVTTTF